MQFKKTCDVDTHDKKTHRHIPDDAVALEEDAVHLHINGRVFESLPDADVEK
jgi:hypothetical protein